MIAWVFPSGNWAADGEGQSDGWSSFAPPAPHTNMKLYEDDEAGDVQTCEGGDEKQLLGKDGVCVWIHTWQQYLCK